MKKIFLYALAASLSCAAPAAAQFTVTAPAAGTTNVKAADDFATTAFQDPWDMSQRTDVGWWLFGTDFAPSNWINPTFSGGVFSGTTAGAGARLFLLESGLLPTPGGSATPIGKTGQQFPINANKYTHLLYRMSSPTGFQDTGNPANLSQYIWSTNTIYQDNTVGASGQVIKGNAIYDIDLRTLPTGGSGWNGTKRSLQFLPNQVTGALITLDWVRLVDGSDPTLFKTISWTGSGNADVYLDNDNVGSNGNLGRIAINVSAKSISFFVGGLPAGTYFAAVRTHVPGAADVTNGSGFAYSPGSFVVNGIPTLQFTTPSDEGSSEDFATTRLGNPWDFTSPSDIDRTENIISSSFTPLALTSEAGTSLGSPTVYLATAASAGETAAGGVGDPQVFPLFWDGRGKVTRIDPARYRILTIEAGLPDKARSLVNGSIGRVLWRAVNEPARDGNNVGLQTVGEHFVMNSKAGENTVARVTIDMKNYPIEPSSTAKSAWLSGTSLAGIDSIRFDPHEFDPSQPSLRQPFFMKRMKLAALERTVDNVITLQWTYSEGSGTVQFFREPASAPKTFSSGTAISGSVSATTGSFAWNAGAVPDGEYHIYAVFSDGTNTNQVYAPTDVVVDHSNVAVKQINLNRTQLNFSIFGPIRTQAQTIRLTFTGSGSECWTSSSDLGSLISVSPASGNGATNISIAPAAAANFPGGTTNGLITIQSCTNSANARVIAVAVTSLNTTTAPAGSMDTPAAGATVRGSVAVTGWAADDVEVLNVRICRGPIPASEATTPGLCGGQGHVYIGDAVFVDDARSDIETANPTKPFNYRAGWGYLLLTNFLPNQGNGAVSLFAYATDRDGHTALLGSKTVTAANSSATKPFGAIDTPGQGEVVCGTSYVNFGWALTQPPKDIAANSSTISVFIDGVFAGRPGTRAARADITSAFPGYNTTHAVGGFAFNTTAYANGVHSIFWLVSDSSGQQDGIGSRFFTVSNPCSGS